MTHWISTGTSTLKSRGLRNYLYLQYIDESKNNGTDRKSVLYNFKRFLSKSQRGCDRTVLQKVTEWIKASDIASLSKIPRENILKIADSIAENCWIYFHSQKIKIYYLMFRLVLNTQIFSVPAPDIILRQKLKMLMT